MFKGQIARDQEVKTSPLSAAEMCTLAKVPATVESRLPFTVNSALFSNVCLHYRTCHRMKKKITENVPEPLAVVFGSSVFIYLFIFIFTTTFSQ